MKNSLPASAGFFSFVLHAHLPYVLHHGTWPHGLEWLLEAAAETYLPLLRTARHLHAESIPLCLNVSVSPVLLEQLAHPDFLAELPNYLQRKITSAREDAAFFEQADEQHLLYLAQHWERFFQDALDDLNALGGDLIAGFRQAEATGSMHLLTSAATHGYAPLLGTDESIRGQFQTAVRAHQRHLGTVPQGVWLPECGYRPAGLWRFPVAPAGDAKIEPARARVGVETALAEAGLRFTFVDTHLVEGAEKLPPADRAGKPVAITPTTDAKSLYRPYRIDASDVAVFARDPLTAVQVWSAQNGYPGDFHYLDFHKKRWPGGHRYWRVTGAGLGMESKEPYYPEAAMERSRAHAEHFVEMVAETLRSQPTVDGTPPLMCAPFDLELFGHWWHEGMLFLENVARVLADGKHGVRPTTCAAYLEEFGTDGRIRMPEGSWGANGDNSVWLNGDTTSLLARMYAAELSVRAASRQAAWTDGGTGERIARQMCRELLLMESSDWPTLITTGAARDYAEKRFAYHAESFSATHAAWESFLANGSLAETDAARLAEMEAEDCLFADLKTSAWQPQA
ncbi:glycoside hydrolase family 57 protein [Terriglobus roseus]|uniref:1,4-alpha-glucan branching enzyme n=1 Tax=Terriglobus roseus TaxID=392734 RepID=A0A1H4R3J1_9BACT|nr:1,4-alpha-glucan branching protein domain-containing protein [Terriglobus roseus]SEC26294.1 1,4-alpha-glucan branching enzyme [Terriglobus roseus]